MPKKGEYKKGATADSIRQRRYNSRPEQKKRRAARNAARAKMMKQGKVRKGDGKDVHHKDYNAKHNSTGNLGVMDRSRNRAKNRGTGGRKKGR